MTEDKSLDLAAKAGDVSAGAGERPLPEDLLGATPPEAGIEQPFKVANKVDSSQQDSEAAMLSMLENLPQEERSASADDINFSSASVAKAAFQQLSQPASSGEQRNIDLLMDVSLPVSIELGRTKLSISEILALGPGSVVELNKLAGEPVNLWSIRRRLPRARWWWSTKISGFELPNW